MSVQCVGAALLISVDPCITIIRAQSKARGFARRFRVFLRVSTKVFFLNDTFFMPCISL